MEKILTEGLVRNCSRFTSKMDIVVGNLNDYGIEYSNTLDYAFRVLELSIIALKLNLLTILLEHY